MRPDPLSARQRRILVTTCCSHALIHVFELSIPALLLLIQTEFALDDFRMGEIVTIYGLLFGLGALPAGLLVDRLGSKSLLLLCLWGGSVALIGMALSPSAPLFTVSAALMGLALSAYHPAGTALVTHALPATGRVFALHGMAGNLGVAGASVMAGSLGALFGWRWALGLLSAIGIALGGLAATLPAPELHEIRARRGEGNWVALALLLIAAAFMGMVYRGLTTFLPKFFAVRLVEDIHTGTAIGGALTTAALLVGIAGMWLAGRASDRGRAPILIFFVGGLLQAPFLIALGWVGNAGIVPIAMGIAFFHFVTQPVGNQMVAQFTPPRLRGLGYGLYFFLAFGTGALGAGFGGWVSDRFGLDRIFPALATLLVPALLAALAIAASLRRSRLVEHAPPPESTC